MKISAGFVILFFVLSLGGCGGGGGSAAPSVTSVNPSADAAGVEPNAGIAATFSTEMDETTLTTETFIVTRPAASETAAAINKNAATSFSVNVRGTVTYDNKVATFTPSQPLVLFTPYTVTVKSSVKDASGNSMGADYSWTFSIREGVWGTAQKIETEDANDAMSPQIAVDLNGNAISVWQQDDNTFENIWVNRYIPGTGWSAAGKIENGTGDAEFPQIAFDPNGNAIAVWQQDDGTRTNIWASFYTAGAAWDLPEIIDTEEAGDAMRPQIAFDALGNAFAVWRQESSIGTFNIWANYYTAGTGWGTAVKIESDEANDAGIPQIAFDPNGNAIAVWEQSDGTRFNIVANRHTFGTGWGSAIIIDTENAGHAEAPQIAFDPSGNAIAVWHQNDGTRTNIWANLYTAGTGWGTAEKIETDDADNALYPEIAFDPSGNAIAVWGQSDGTYFHIWANFYTAGTGWSTPLKIEANDTAYSNNAQIAFDPSGNAIAVWQQGSGVIFSIWANRYKTDTGWWGSETLIETDDSGDAQIPQIAIDASGRATAVWIQSDGTRYNIWANRFE